MAMVAEEGKTHVLPATDQAADSPCMHAGRLAPHAMMASSERIGV